MIFNDKPYLKITAGIVGSKNKVTTDGITSQAFTPEEAKTQLDKLFGVVGKSVQTDGMVRIRTEEAIDNG